MTYTLGVRKIHEKKDWPIISNWVSFCGFIRFFKNADRKKDVLIVFSILKLFFLSNLIIDVGLKL